MAVLTEQPSYGPGRLFHFSSSVLPPQGYVQGTFTSPALTWCSWVVHVTYLARYLGFSPCGMVCFTVRVILGTEPGVFGQLHLVDCQ